MAGEYDNDYTVLDLDLSTLAGKGVVEVYQAGKPVAAVTVVELPAGAVGNVRLQFGEQGAGIKLRQEAVTIGRNPARSNGIFLNVAAGQVGNLELLIGIDLNVNA